METHDRERVFPSDELNVDDLTLNNLFQEFAESPQMHRDHCEKSKRGP